MGGRCYSTKNKSGLRLTSNFKFPLSWGGGDTSTDKDTSKIFLMVAELTTIPVTSSTQTGQQINPQQTTRSTFEVYDGSLIKDGFPNFVMHTTNPHIVV